MGSIRNATTKLRLPALPTISEIVKLYKLRALKKLSQNFLLDRNITDKIARSAGDLNKKFVIEVGPGPGGITRSCIEAGVSGIAMIEKDLRFMEGLQLIAESVENSVDFKIYHGDVLSFNMLKCVPDSMPKLNWDSDEESGLHIIGNLPFNISLPLLFKLMRQISLKHEIFSYGRVPMTLTFQQEVGERIVCPPLYGERSRISIMTQYLCDVRYKFKIPGSAFVPAPKVDVAVLQLRPLKKPLIDQNFDLIEKVVKNVFQFKNTKWDKGYSKLFPNKQYNDEIKAIGVDSEKTSVQLTIEDFARLCDFYATKVTKEPTLIQYDARGQSTLPKYSDYL